MSHIYLDRRRPCFECSLSLQRVKGKGYYAVIVDVNGIPQYMHRLCAEMRDDPEFVEYVEGVIDSKEMRRRDGYNLRLE